MPWLLSGARDVGNVAAAVAVSGARAVDGSGVEVAPGVKDPDLLASFLAAVRGR
ncbi:MAG: hypothetical protein AAGA17_11655 [Actinomycetota bacterium]